VTDRDYFAAAALTGLLSDSTYQVPNLPFAAYDWAEAMLREQAKRSEQGAVKEVAPSSENGYPTLSRNWIGVFCESVIWAAFEATDANGFSRNVAVMDKLRLALRPLIEGTLEQVACELRNGSLTLTDAEREAIGVAIQCVEAARAQRHPEEEDARDLLWKTTCGLRSLFGRTDRT
jgi:hypothetical protein